MSNSNEYQCASCVKFGNNVAEAWNTRAEITGNGFVVDYTDQTECAAYKCLTCGKRSYTSAPKYCPQCGVKLGC